MQFFREERMRVVKHLAGHRYSSQGALKRTYVNTISLYANIVGRNLISKNPRVSLSTFDRGQKPVVTAMETWINDEFELIDFASNLQRIVLDALCSIGIAKVALATPADAANVGWGLQAGAPFIARVDLDDFVFDHHARDFSEAGFIGHRYRVPLASILDDKRYSKKARENLSASAHSPFNRQGDEKIGMIGRSYYGVDQEFEDMVDLWELYVPRHRAVVTFAEDDFSGPFGVWEGGKAEPLEEKPFLGPDTGPYRVLAYQWIPGNPFPKGPLQDVVELHEALNESYRKLVRQAARQKTVTAYQKENDADGKAIERTDDGGMVGLSVPGSVQEVAMGGPNQGLFLFMKEMFDRLSLMAGNLVTMGGLAPQANTLGQEELLASQSNGQVANMQDTTVAFVSDVSKSMLWYWWHDPSRIMTTKLQGIPGIDLAIKVHPWTHPDPAALRRDGPLPAIKIDPYSMRARTPQQRAQDLTQIVTNVYVPMAQLAQQQGVSFDFNAFLGIMARLLDMPDLQSILSIAEPMQDAPSGAPGLGETGPAPAHTTREYVRRSAGGQGRQAQQAGMDAILQTGGGKSSGWNGSLQKA